MTWFHEIEYLTAEQHAARQRQQQLTDEQKARQQAEAQQQAQNDAWARIQAQEAAWKGQQERASLRGGQLQRGRELLGLVEHQGRWQQRYAEQTGGLPAGVVEAARRAVAAEQAAWQTLERAHNAALSYCQQHQLSGESARVKIELGRAEPMTAYNAARTAADRACQTLGDVAGQVEAARATLGQVDVRRAEAEQQRQQQLAEIARDEDAARAVLVRLGIAE